MGVAKRGRSSRRIRPRVGFIDRPGAGLKGENEKFWRAIGLGEPGARQGRCRLGHAASGCISSAAVAIATSESRSGLRGDSANWCPVAPGARPACWVKPTAPGRQFAIGTDIVGVLSAFCWAIER